MCWYLLLKWLQVQVHDGRLEYILTIVSSLIVFEAVMWKLNVFMCMYNDIITRLKLLVDDWQSVLISIIALWYLD